jgi:hypothetical protein
MNDKLNTLPYLKFDGKTITVYVEDWWDDEYRTVLAMTLDYTERMIGKKLERVYTTDPPPPGLLRADAMFAKMNTEKEYKN